MHTCPAINGTKVGGCVSSRVRGRSTEENSHIQADSLLLDWEHHCCHSNLCRALSENRGLSLRDAENFVHDVLNVFMCTGFTHDTHQYFMKQSPVRPGDYIEFVADQPLLGALSACPGGDCSTTHSSDAASCYPLMVEVFEPTEAWLLNFNQPKASTYRLK